MVRLLRSRAAVSAVALVLALSIVSACNEKQSRGGIAHPRCRRPRILANSTLDANGKPLLLHGRYRRGAAIRESGIGRDSGIGQRVWKKSRSRTGWSAAVDDIQAKHPNAGTTLRVALAGGDGRDRGAVHGPV